MRKFIVFSSLIALMVLSACNGEDINDNVDDRNQDTNVEDVIDDTPINEETPFVIEIVFDQEVTDVTFLNDDSPVNYETDDNLTFRLDATNIDVINIFSDSVSFNASSVVLSEDTRYFITVVVAEEPSDEYNRILSLLEEGETLITFEDNVTGNFVLDEGVEFDLNGFTLNGDIDVNFSFFRFRIRNGTFNGLISINTAVQTINVDALGDTTVRINNASSQLSFSENVSLILNYSREFLINDDLESILILTDDVLLRLRADIDQVEIAENVENTFIFGGDRVRHLITNGVNTRVNALPETVTGEEMITAEPIAVTGFNPNVIFIDRPHGDNLEDLEALLRETVLVRLEGNMLEFFQVDWDEIIHFDATRIDAYSFSVRGDLILPKGFINENNLRPMIIFRIAEAAIPVTSVEFFSDLVFEDVETKFQDILDDLPTEASFNAGDREFIVNIDWEFDETMFDETAYRGLNITLRGVLELPAGIVNPNEVAAEITVFIPAHIQEPSGLFSIQTSLPGAPTPIVTSSNGFEEGSVIEIDIQETTNYVYLRTVYFDDESLVYTTESSFNLTLTDEAVHLIAVYEYVVPEEGFIID